MPVVVQEDLEQTLTASIEDATDQDALRFLREGTQPEAKTPSADDGPSVLSQVGTAAKNVAVDIASGAKEIPRAIGRGTINAVQETLDLTDSLADFISNSLPEGVPNPAIQITNKQGEFDPAFIAHLDPADTGFGELPNLPETTTVTSGLVEGITQFLVGFAGAGKLPGIANLSKLPITQAALKGAIADFSVFDAHEGRLANLIESFPALKNPITDFLAAKPGDSELEGRLKNAVEGLGAGLLVDGLVKGLKTLRAARKARQQVSSLAGSVDQVDEVVRPEVSADTLRPLGDVASDEIVTRIQRKANESIRATETGVPDDVAARGLTKVTEVGGDEFFVNFAKIDTPDDVKKTIGLMTDAFADDLKKSQRGVRTHAQTQASAESIDAFKVLTERADAAPLNAEQTVAIREFWHAAGTKLEEVAAIAAQEPSASNLFAFRKMLATFHAIQGEVISVRTETARALNAWKIPAGTGKERFTALGDMVEQFGGTEVNKEFAERIARLSTEKGIAAISASVDAGVLARTRDAVLQYWINALLSGPKTHIVNMASNSMVIAQVIGERAVAARIGKLFGDQGVEVGEAMAAAYGVKAGFTDAFANAAKAFRENTSGFGIGKIDLPRANAISSTAFNLRNNSFVGRAVDSIGAITSVPGRALTAEDEVFKTIGYRMELHALAFRQASREARSGLIEQADIKSRMFDIVADPPDNIKLASIDAARYQTFTNKTGDLAQAALRIANKYPTARFLGLTFINTPANILKFSFERTPLAPLMQTVRDEIMAGGARQQTQLARLAVGSAMTSIAFDMAYNGLLTGGGPENRSELGAMRRSGWQRYSVKMDNRFFAYNRLDNLGFSLGLAADVAEYVQNLQADSSSGAEIGEMAAAVAAAFAGNITNKTYFQGMTNLIEAMNEPKRFSEVWLNRFAGSFVPTGVKEIEGFIDPHLRSAHDIVTSMRARTPGLSDSLPVVRDLWGRPVSFSSGIKPDVLGFAYDMVSPIYSREFKPEPIDEEMLRGNFFVGRPSKRLTFSGTTLNFRNRPDLYYRYVELAGNSLKHPDFNLGAKDLLNKIVTGKHELSADYNALPDDQFKESFVRKIISQYRRLAKQQLIQEFPEINREVAASEGRKRTLILGQ